MIFESAVISHIGCRRENNEDNYYLNGVYKQNVEKEITQFEEPQAGRNILAGVFDGAGGAAYGERASLMAAASLAEYQEGLSSKKIIKNYIPHVNDLILREMNQIGDTMGTTLAMLYLDGETANVYNLGDSRIYLFRERRLMQITYDHTQEQLLQEKIADSPAGMYQKEIQHSKGKHLLTKYLGMKNLKELKPYFMERIPVLKHDIFILCSDGLYNMVSKENMCKCLKKERKEPPLEIARAMAGEALLAGGKDNVTCMVVKAESLEESV